MVERVFTEEYDWRNKGIVNLGSFVKMFVWNIDIQRNSIDGSFDAKENSDFSRFKHSFSLNNKSFTIGNADRSGFFSAHSSVFSSTPLSKVESLATTTIELSNTNFATFVIFPKRHPFNKNIVLAQNEYLKLKSLNTIEFKVDIENNQDTQYYYNILPKITYTDTYVVPHEFDPLNPSEELFDIYVTNENGDHRPEGDIAYNDGEMTTSATGTTKFKLNTISSLGDKDTFEQAPKVSTISVFDSTKYDYEKGKVEVGYGEDSRKGVLVPYNFKGEYRRTFDISPNKAFEHLKVTFSNDIKEPMLDPYEGRVILHIKDLVYKNNSDVPIVPWKIISSENFERLKTIDPSIIGIDRLAYENNL